MHLHFQDLHSRKRYFRGMINKNRFCTEIKLMWKFIVGAIIMRQISQFVTFNTI